MVRRHHKNRAFVKLPSPPHFGNPDRGPHQSGGTNETGGTNQTDPPGAPGQSTGGAPRPQDRPPANDDDIVARQLREAAERETDPVLKEKLWREYDKYKGDD